MTRKKVPKSDKDNATKATRSLSYAFVPKGRQLSKTELNEMLHEAVLNTPAPDGADDVEPPKEENG